MSVIVAAVRKWICKELCLTSNKSAFIKSGPAVIQAVKSIKCRQQPGRLGGIYGMKAAG